MTETLNTLDILEADEDYTWPSAPHIAWEKAKFIDNVGDSQRVSHGARLFLRDRRRTLATAEVEGNWSAIRDVLDDLETESVAWLPTMRHLAHAVRKERQADYLELHIGQLLSHWQRAHQEPEPFYDHEDYNRDVEAAYKHEEAVRAVVPRELQKASRLPDACQQHAAWLREAAREDRAEAVRSMPETPQQGTFPWVYWVGPYSRDKGQQIPQEEWLVDLPHQLLMGWRELPEGERTELRDALIRWAGVRQLPKMTMAKASGVARSTIDRVLNTAP